LLHKVILTNVVWEFVAIIKYLINGEEDGIFRKMAEKKDQGGIMRKCFFESIVYIMII
jgi:hypothetical protein